MAENVLTVAKRDGKGKGPARRLRSQGLIPAVVYGRMSEPSHISVDPGLLLKAIETPHKLNTLLTLKLDGGEKHVLFKEYEVDPVTRKLLHADFLEVKLDQPVRVTVPVVTTGKAAGVAEGGILSIAAHDIVVEALPAKIPVRIEVDVTELKIGRSIHVSELKAPEGCKFKFATDYVVAFVAVPEKEEVVVPVAAAPGAAPAEGAAAAPAGGAAPAAGAAAPAAGAAPAAAKGAKPAEKGGKK
ncbi:50S ribosomal protein L25/general stress protein Ctc [Anaeromyxobacter oryzisoli]|uniref:50S ribosomal protein L25/general stress protein Ctc n=1 Tax=Anaeromyxobacter oryzisoli TaxID=2925408 RepID=UPI001F57889C|nr:50S ribosomal protein L25/general stress protein Ctc [Anaeromyxobacter sp. SG63]